MDDLEMGRLGHVMDCICGNCYFSMLGISNLAMGRFGHVMDDICWNVFDLCSESATWEWDDLDM